MKVDSKFLTRVLLRFAKGKTLVLHPQPHQHPLFVMGMFRSGTSLTCQILQKNKIPLTPKWRLLKGKGVLKDLNPNGFFEDFLFANLARYWIHKLGSSGAEPPHEEAISSISFTTIPLRNFIRFAECISPDDRISYFNRHRAYLWLLLRGEKAFYFKQRRVVKIPMLLLFHKHLRAWLPNAKYLIVIRNPDATIKSSKVLTELSSIHLYNHYYQFLKQLEEENKEHCQVFSYDNLLKNPSSSIQSLTQALGVPFRQESVKLIEPKLIRSENKNVNTSDDYHFLFQKIINKI